MAPSLQLCVATLRRVAGFGVMTSGHKVQAVFWWNLRLEAVAVAGTPPGHHGTNWFGHSRVCQEVSHRPQQLSGHTGHTWLRTQSIPFQCSWHQLCMLSSSSLAFSLSKRSITPHLGDLGLHKSHRYTSCVRWGLEHWGFLCYSWTDH